MAKYYFQYNDENCYELIHHIHYMNENGLTKMEVYEAEADFGSGYFYCKHYMEVGEAGEGCGKECNAYKPRNGKNGRCVHSGYVYIPTDKKKVITLQFNKK